MGEELGRKAALGLLLLGTGTIVVGALALTGWLLYRIIRHQLAERRARVAAEHAIGIREIEAARRVRGGAEQRDAAAVGRSA